MKKSKRDEDKIEFIKDQDRTMYILISSIFNTIVADNWQGAGAVSMRFEYHCVSQVNENKKRPESVAYNKELAKSAP